MLGALLLIEGPWTLRMDNSGRFLSLTLEAVRAWGRGEFPHWSDRIWGGLPLIGNMEAGPFYLPHLPIFWLAGMPPIRAFDIAIAVHLGLFTAGTFRLLGLLGLGSTARALGAVLALFCPFAHWAGMTFFPVLATYAWWPWAFGAVEQLARREIPRASGALVLGWVAFAAQVFVGMPEQGLYCAVVAGAWLLTRRAGLGFRERLLRLGLLGMGAVALAAPQLVPTMLYVPITTRAGGVGPHAGLVRLSLHAPARLFVPGALAPTEVPSFLGLAALCLAGVAVASRRPRAAFLACTAAVAFVLALGSQTFVHALVHQLPPFDLFRTPLKFQALVEFSLVWAAAIGAEVLWSSPRQAMRLAGIVLAVAAVGERSVYVAHEIVHFRNERAQARNDAAVLRALAGSTVLTRREVGGSPPLVLDTWGPKLVGGSTVYGLHAGNLPAVCGIASINGTGLALLSRRHTALLGQRWLSPAAIDIFGARYVIARPSVCGGVQARLGFPVVEETDVICVLENPHPRPRYEWVEQSRAVASEEAMIEAVLSDPGGPVPILASDGASLPSRTGEASLTVVDYRAGDVRLHVEAASERLLLARHSWVPGWQAWIDGVAAEIHPAAGIYFVVPVPAGVHAVELRYRTPGLNAGLAIATAWVAAAVGWVWWGRRRGARG